MKGRCRLDLLKGKCPKCGREYIIGWALCNPEHQTCPKCGAKLEITEGCGASDEKKETEKTIDRPENPPRF